MGANGDLLREVFRRVNDREFASLGVDLISPDFVRHDLADLFVGVEGQQGVQDFLAMLTAAAPDLRLTIHDLIEDGDRVAVRFTLAGTHTAAPLLGAGPTELCSNSMPSTPTAWNTAGSPRPGSFKTVSDSTAPSDSGRRRPAVHPAQADLAKTLDRLRR